MHRDTSQEQQGGHVAGVERDRGRVEGGEVCGVKEGRSEQALRGQVAHCKDIDFQSE